MQSPRLGVRKKKKRKATKTKENFRGIKGGENQGKAGRGTQGGLANAVLTGKEGACLRRGEMEGKETVCRAKEVQAQGREEEKPCAGTNGPNPKESVTDPQLDKNHHQSACTAY